MVTSIKTNSLTRTQQLLWIHWALNLQGNRIELWPTRQQELSTGTGLKCQERFRRVSSTPPKNLPPNMQHKAPMLCTTIVSRVVSLTELFKRSPVLIIMAPVQYYPSPRLQILTNQKLRMSDRLARRTPTALIVRHIPRRPANTPQCKKTLPPKGHKLQQPSQWDIFKESPIPFPYSIGGLHSTTESQRVMVHSMLSRCVFLPVFTWWPAWRQAVHRIWQSILGG